jgi:thiamine pyrophosphate-dependent acetolactate synthase large subunit-like protein
MYGHFYFTDFKFEVDGVNDEFQIDRAPLLASEIENKHKTHVSMVKKQILENLFEACNEMNRLYCQQVEEHSQKLANEEEEKTSEIIEQPKVIEYAMKSLIDKALIITLGRFV